MFQDELVIAYSEKREAEIKLGEIAKWDMKVGDKISLVGVDIKAIGADKSLDVEFKKSKMKEFGEQLKVLEEETARVMAAYQKANAELTEKTKHWRKLCAADGKLIYRRFYKGYTYEGPE